MLPNLIIAGVPKAGTTSLFQYLVSHPDICGSGKKETQYFRPLLDGGHPGPVDDYQRHFRHCAGERYRLEATPEYFYGRESIVAAMRELLEDWKVILVLREPISRLVSFYRFKKSRFELPGDLGIESYIAACDDINDRDRLARCNSPFMGIEGGCYDNYIDPWLAGLGQQLKILFFDDLIADFPRVLVKLADWLGIDPAGFPNHSFPQQNRAASFRWASLQRLALTVADRAERTRLNQSRLYRGLRSAYFKVNSRPAPDCLGSDLAGQLRERFLIHNYRLGKRLSEHAYSDLPGWLTDLQPNCRSTSLL